MDNLGDLELKELADALYEDILKLSKGYVSEYINYFVESFSIINKINNSRSHAAHYTTFAMKKLDEDAVELQRFVDSSYEKIRTASFALHEQEGTFEIEKALVSFNEMQLTTLNEIHNRCASFKNSKQIWNERIQEKRQSAKALQIKKYTELLELKQLLLKDFCLRQLFLEQQSSASD